MRRTLRSLVPSLSRRAWLVIACQWLAIYAVLWFAIPIKPCVTLHCDHSVVPIGFGDDGRTLLTLDQDEGGTGWEFGAMARGPVRRWELATHAEIETTPLDWSGRSGDVLLVPGGAMIAVPVGMHLQDLAVHRLGDGRELCRGSPLWSLPRRTLFDGFWRGGKWFLSWLEEDAYGIRTIATEDGREWRWQLATDESCLDFEFGPDETSLTLVRTSDDKARTSVERWSLLDRKLLWTSAVRCETLAISPDGGWIAAGHVTTAVFKQTPDGRSVERADSMVRLLDAESGQVVREFPAPGFLVDELHFNRSNTRLTATQRMRRFSWEGRADVESVVTWDVETGQQILHLRSSDRSYLANVIQSSNVTTRAMRGGEGSLIHRYDGEQRRSALVRFEDGRETFNWPGDGIVHSLSRDGRHLLMHQFSDDPGTGVKANLRALAARFGLEWRDENQWSLRDLAGWGRTIVLPRDTPFTTAFSPDGRRFVGQYSDGRTLFIWDLPARPTVGQLLAWSAGPCVLSFLLTWGWCAWRRRRIACS